MKRNGLFVAIAIAVHGIGAAPWITQGDARVWQVARQRPELWDS